MISEYCLIKKLIENKELLSTFKNFDDSYNIKVFTFGNEVSVRFFKSHYLIFYININNDEIYTSHSKKSMKIIPYIEMDEIEFTLSYVRNSLDINPFYVNLLSNFLNRNLT